MLNNTLVPGMKIKLPIKSLKQLNKNHIKIEPKEQKNTNNQNYIIPEAEENPQAKSQLNSFLSGFSN